MLEQLDIRKLKRITTAHILISDFIVFPSNQLRSHPCGEAELKEAGGAKSPQPGETTQGSVSGCPERGQFAGESQAIVYFNLSSG